MESETTTGNGTTPPTTTRGTVTTDKDLVAITKIGKLLSELDDGDRSRVLRFIAEKYEAELS